MYGGLGFAVTKGDVARMNGVRKNVFYCDFICCRKHLWNNSSEFMKYLRKSTWN